MAQLNILVCSLKHFWTHFEIKLQTTSARTGNEKRQNKRRRRYITAVWSEIEARSFTRVHCVASGAAGGGGVVSLFFYGSSCNIFQKRKQYTVKQRDVPVSFPSVRPSVLSVQSVKIELK